MTSLTELLQPGQGYSWLYVPSAMLLGALHGLEPGHSKTMMAAFIVAIRGTIGQAILLGAMAALSHTAIVWIIAALGMYFGARFNTAQVEPVMQLVAAVAVLLIALWMLWRTWRNTHAASHGDGHDHDHDHGHRHEHAGLDDHAREHAEALRRTLGKGPVTHSRIALFGLTGGLVPCPASITVLMVCLQLKQVALGSVLVLCFGVGLALTLVVSGIVAALGVRHASRYFSSMEGLGARAPYLSGALMLLVSFYMLTLALRGFGAPLSG
jgi:ABC-type nickel/cobalt efflux system permease component RcnA